MNHEIKITSLTPIHIGNGVELNPNYEYLHFDAEKRIAVIDEDKVFDLLHGEVSNWVNTIDQEKSMLELLRTWKSDVRSEDCAKRVMHVNHVPTGEGKIKEQMRGDLQQYPMLPGSSLKGAFRTAVLTHLIKEDGYFVTKKQNLGTTRRGRFQYKDQQIVAHFFGQKDRKDREGNLQLDANKDWFRFLRFSDYHFKGAAPTEINNIQILNLHRNGWQIKKREQSFWECLPKDRVANGRIQIPDELIKQNKRKNLPLPKAQLLQLEHLFGIINDHTYKLLGKELDFWEDEGNPAELGSYFDELERLYELVNDCDDQGCILRVGAGSGWNFMTGGWAEDPDLLDDRTWEDLKNSMRRGKYRDMIFPKSRKLVHGGMPLGFLRVDII